MGIWWSRKFEYHDEKMKTEDKKPTTKTIKSLTKPILEKHGIKRAGLFGSVVSEERATNNVGLLVGIDKKMSLLEFIGLQQELEDMIECTVNLVEYSAIKPSLKHTILQEEQPLF